MYSREDLADLIEKYIHALPFPAGPGGLYRPVVYTLEEGGKRLRPVLLLMTCDACAGDTEDALPCAAAIEVFHNFTLLHDDIMDNADVRRGKSSVHRKWGRNVAILSGDAMVIYAYSLLQKAPAGLLPAIMAEFNKMALEVCEGQQYDMDFENRDDVTLEEYGNMIRLKTAVIFGASARIGAMMGGASEEDCRTLYDFGIEMGLAFQIQDDFLDTYGTSEILGKEVGGDIAESKKTFLTINALNSADAAARRSLLDTLKDRALPLPDKMERVKAIYDSLSVPGVTLGIIDRHLAAAEARLDALSTVKAEKTAALRKLIRGLANRNK